MRERIINLHIMYSPIFLAAAAFLLPIKLSLTYFALVPVLLLWMGAFFARRGEVKFSPGLPEAYFLCGSIFMLLAPFGDNPFRSLNEMPTIFFYGILLFAAREIVSNTGAGHVLRPLAFGSCIASIGTILNGLFPKVIPRLFLGQISESGQLAIILPLFIGIFLLNGGAAYLKNKFLIYGTIPLGLIALIINLKRGPWAGVLIVCLLMGLGARKFKHCLVAVVIVAATFLFIPGVSSRILASEHDFFGPGGRKEMWDIAAMIAQRNPLGVGFDNSKILRHYTDRIPVELSHFHSNAINLLVEVGWLGAFSLAWFLLLIVKTSLSNKKLYPYGAAIVSSQIAGIVEYNFGDSKVYLLSLLVVGVLAGLATETKLTQKD